MGCSFAIYEVLFESSKKSCLHRTVILKSKTFLKSRKWFDSFSVPVIVALVFFISVIISVSDEQFLAGKRSP